MDLHYDQQPSTQPLAAAKPHQFLLSCSILFKRETGLVLSFLLLIFLSFLFLFNHPAAGPIQPQFLLHPTDFLSKRINPSSGRRNIGCDYSNGRWVRDENYTLGGAYTEDCMFLDPGFQCHRNGREDRDYLKWRWQPMGCDLPRFNSSDFLERSRNGRIVFAGDSIGRNQWESLICMLSQAVSNPSADIYEENGNPISKHKNSLSFRFRHYNLTVEYYRVPFLVIIDRPPKNSSSEIRSAIRVDTLHWRSKQWIGADVLIFNAGHWWNQDKTLKMGSFFQEGASVNKTMDVREAFQRFLQTWKSWVIQNLDPAKSHIFFRSYSPVHYRDGTWDSGGRCDLNTAPDYYTKLEEEPWNNHFIAETIEQMKLVNNKNSNVEFLNITYLTELRKDGHPSLHREPGTPVHSPQDCSHWCLPGVPDTWNQLLYAHLLSKGFTTEHTHTTVKNHSVSQ